MGDRARDRERQRELRVTRRAAGLCTRCGKHPKSSATQLCDECREYFQQRFQWEKANPEWREKRRTQLQQWTDNHSEQARERFRRFVSHARDELLDHYGRICVCCGESANEFLTFNRYRGINAEMDIHVRARRDLLSPSATTALRNEMRRRGWPPDVQTMCWNCVAATTYFGMCPHPKRSVL